MDITTTYDPTSVGLSILIATLASYTALDLGGSDSDSNGLDHCGVAAAGHDGRWYLVDALRRHVGLSDDSPGDLRHRTNLMLLSLCSRPDTDLTRSWRMSRSGSRKSFHGNLSTTN